MKHVLRSQQFKDPRDLDKLLDSASEMEKRCLSGSCPQVLQGKILANLFYEPSTRTRLSFESAMVRLGGTVIGTENAAQFSSALKGESLEDSIRVVQKYADVIVLRHPMEGSSEKASHVSSVPIINAGDGAGQHPTQTFLDVYTIRKELGRLDRLKVAMVGDLLYGRTVHSLTYLFAHRRDIDLVFVSPEQLRLPQEMRDYLKRKGVPFRETESLDDVLDVDVLYMTRIQKERFASEAEYLKLRGSFVIDRSLMDKLGKKAIVLHPLPRVDEISPEVDSDPRAVYFRQAENGLYIRMALLKMLLCDDQ